jgi:hypothetical protein
VKNPSQENLEWFIHRDLGSSTKHRSGVPNMCCVKNPYGFSRKPLFLISVHVYATQLPVFNATGLAAKITVILTYRQAATKPLFGICHLSRQIF